MTKLVKLLKRKVMKDACRSWHLSPQGHVFRWTKTVSVFHVQSEHFMIVKYTFVQTILSYSSTQTSRRRHSQV